MKPKRKRRSSVTIRFILPDDRREAQNAIDAGKAFSFLFNLSESLKQRLDCSRKDDRKFLEELSTELREEFPDIDER